MNAFIILIILLLLLFFFLAIFNEQRVIIDRFHFQNRDQRNACGNTVATTRGLHQSYLKIT